jgi:hypothetical protein
VLRIFVLAGVAVALVVTLAISGTSVLPKLADDRDAGPGTTRPTPAHTPTATTSGSPTVNDPEAPLPGTVLTARPAPRRCPSPPCVPAD